MCLVREVFIAVKKEMNAVQLHRTEHTTMYQCHTHTHTHTHVLMTVCVGGCIGVWRTNQKTDLHASHTIGRKSEWTKHIAVDDNTNVHAHVYNIHTTLKATSCNDSRMA